MGGGKIQSYEIKTTYSQTPYLVVNKNSYVELTSKTNTNILLNAKVNDGTYIPIVLTTTTTSSSSTPYVSTKTYTKTTGYSGRTSSGSYRTTASGTSSSRYSTTDYSAWYDDFTPSHTGTSQVSGTSSRSSSKKYYTGYTSYSANYTIKWNISSTGSSRCPNGWHYTENNQQTLTRSGTYTSSQSYTYNSYSVTSSRTISDYLIDYSTYSYVQNSSSYSRSGTYVGWDSERTASTIHSTSTTTCHIGSGTRRSTCMTNIMASKSSSSSTRTTTYSTRTTATGYRSSTYTRTDYKPWGAGFTPGATHQVYVSGSGYSNATNSNGMYSTTALTRTSTSTMNSSTSSSTTTTTLNG